MTIINKLSFQLKTLQKPVKLLNFTIGLMVAFSIGFKAHATDLKLKLTEVSHTDDEAHITEKNTNTLHESLKTATSSDIYIAEDAIFYVDKATISTLQKHFSKDKTTQQTVAQQQHKRN